MHTLDSFHPAIREWFAGRFERPTDAQEAAWPRIRSGRDTLIAAPTGSGKTLSAFLVCIDDLLRESERSPLDDRVGVIYVSPLKALGNDIRRNLEEPLDEIAALVRARGGADPGIRVLARSGDSTAAERREIVARPPHILITTPESLYLMLTAERSREILRTARRVIVDEIHTMLRDKRGSHLALTLARLDHVCHARPGRIGLSATQKPLETSARFLVGAGRAPAGAEAACDIVDIGHRRDIDLRVALPQTELQAVCSADQWNDIYDSLAAEIEQHRTTLVFVNTRKMSERIAHQLRRRLGEESVGAHHGSLSKDRRLLVERRLKEGDLRALVATASLELGIDVGAIDLVCQIDSPRSITTLLQRIGRSGHALGLLPKGLLYPTTRDGLAECAALIRAVRAGRLDAVEPPVAPLDVLAQQIVAECACETWGEDDLFRLVRSAAPYAGLDRTSFEEILELLAAGLPPGASRGNAHLHHDRIGRTLRGRRGARGAAIEGGGAIPETADFRVLAQPGDTFVGTVNEDFATESMAGDIFLLGTTSWRILKIEPGVVRVADAAGAPPNIPFWLGEAPGRTVELSREVSRLREEIVAGLGDRESLLERLAAEASLSPEAAEELVRYVEAELAAVGVVPTDRDVVFERFFDDSGGMQLVVHAPFGGRINRAWGLALRKKFCRHFNFELQAAAGEDAFLLSTGAQHSFPVEDLFRYVTEANVAEALAQAVLPTPMFTNRWRWNVTRSLALVRRRYGKRVPPPVQRMRADDLLAAAFPLAVACQEHVHGAIEIPDHPLVRQTMHDCLHEAMDLRRLKDVLRAVERGEIRLHGRETAEPSPFAHEMLNSSPHTFLDDAPLEERRARAVMTRRTLPVEARDLGALDASAVERVCAEAWPEPRDAEEMHDTLASMMLLRDDDAGPWRGFLEELAGRGRAATVRAPGGLFHFAAENLRAVQSLFPGLPVEPAVDLPPEIDLPVGRDEAALLAVRGHTVLSGPITIAELARRTGIDEGVVRGAVARLEGEGILLRGIFRQGRPDAGGEELCNRRLLARIHRLTLERLRREIEPVSRSVYLRFLVGWQHAREGRKLDGKRGLLRAVTLLQGFEAPAAAWEKSILPARVRGYRPGWLDELALSGQVSWGRLSPQSGGGVGRGAPSSASLITFCRRSDLVALLGGLRNRRSPEEPAGGTAREVLDLLRGRGALFFDDIVARGMALPAQIEEALWDLVARGLVTADSFQALRSLMSPARRRAYYRRRRTIRSRDRASIAPSGRWSLLPEAPPGEGEGNDELAEWWAEQLLERYGVVFRDVTARERLALPWRDVVRAFRRLEARGVIRGGRFVTGVYGEQYAQPEAVDRLRRTRAAGGDAGAVTLSAVDPLNLAGILTPGPRIPSVHTESIEIVAGEVLARGGRGDGGGRADRTGSARR